MAVEAYGITDPGSVRAENQDRILFDTGLGIFVLCDGLGGHQHGEVAAEMAVAAVNQYIDASQDRYDVSWPFGYNFDLSLDANRLLTGIKLANRQVWRRAEQNLECAGMGTTVAAALLSYDRVVIGNVGDSRVYRLRGHELLQLSIDDTMLGSMVQRGLLSPAELATHPMRNVLTQSAGSQEEVDVHILEEDVREGDTLLLCSDGLYGVVDDSEIGFILGVEETLEGASRRLVDATIAAGAPDNVSVVLVRHS
jgi:serine/threonine protein phosphatase PrpC